MQFPGGSHWVFWEYLAFVYFSKHLLRVRSDVGCGTQALTAALFFSCSLYQVRQHGLCPWGPTTVSPVRSERTRGCPRTASILFPCSKLRRKQRYPLELGGGQERSVNSEGSVSRNMIPGLSSSGPLGMARFPSMLRWWPLPLQRSRVIAWPSSWFLGVVRAKAKVGRKKKCSMTLGRGGGCGGLPIHRVVVGQPRGFCLVEVC